MNSNLLGQDPLAGETYYPHDLEGMLARVVRVDRVTVESSATWRRTRRLGSRMPVAVAIASLAGASLAGAGLAAAASGVDHAPGLAHTARVAPARSMRFLPHWTPAGTVSVPPTAPVPGPPHWTAAGPGSTPPTAPSVPGRASDS